jgi:flavorubredoxin
MLKLGQVFMKFWPQKKWKKIVLIAVLVFVISVVVVGAIFFKINSDFTSEIDVLNLEGTKTALVIYHPGLASFQQDTTYAFADGLVENGWKVEITTPSSEAPTDLSGYSLLVLGSPVYAGAPAPSLQRHLERIGDLNGIATALIVTSGGSDGEAEATLQQAVEDHDGNVVLVLSLYTSTPNDGDPLTLAEQAGRDLIIAKR